MVGALLTTLERVPHPYWPARYCCHYRSHQCFEHFVLSFDCVLMLSAQIRRFLLCREVEHNNTSALILDAFALVGEDQVTNNQWSPI